MAVLKPKRTRKNKSKCCTPKTIASAVMVFVTVTLLISSYNVHENLNASTELKGKIDELTPPSKSSYVMEEDSNKKWFEKKRPLITEFPVPSVRNDIIGMLEQLKWKTAIEVGVQGGLFAKKMLSNWPSCTEYKLVDLWGKEEGYQEPGGHNKRWHDKVLEMAKHRVKPYLNKTEFFIMRSTSASKLIEDNHFDFVYLDARHDYCAVAEDIAHYWPKVRPGGILAGHDFIDAQYAIDKVGPNENWGICEDGSVQPRAVRGAVEDFAKRENIEFILTSQEGFPSWFIQKPYDD
jgi:hypothetical protein